MSAVWSLSGEKRTFRKPCSTTPINDGLEKRPHQMRFTVMAVTAVVVGRVHAAPVRTCYRATRTPNWLSQKAVSQSQLAGLTIPS
jgi:hypothetical protein